MNPQQQRILAYQAIDDNVKDTCARKVIKWVYEMEIFGTGILRPTNQYFSKKWDWSDKTTRVSITKAKASGFITTVGQGKKRVFELNVQHLKGKMGEIVAKRPIKKTLDFSDVLPVETVAQIPENTPEYIGNSPNTLPNALPNSLPNTLPNTLPNNPSEITSGKSTSNSNSNSKMIYIYEKENPIINNNEEENNEEKTNNEREINNLPYKKEEVINKQVVEEEPDCLSNSGDAQSFLAKKARNAVKRKLKQEYGGIIPPFVNQEEEIKKAGVPSTPSLTVTQTYQVPKSQEFADLLKWMREIKRPASFLPETEDNFLRIRQTFQLAEIKAAIKIALLDDFWKNQFNLNTFLRPSNYKGQPQDNVATFYSRRADNDPQIFAIKQEMKEELEKLAELENNAD